MLSLQDIQDILRIKLIGVIPESEAVLQASNQGLPAVHLKGISAAVCFYGIPPADFADPAQIRIPFQGHFATQDGWCTPAAVAQLESAMKAAGQSPDLHHYEADHAFVNKTRPEVYNEACATLAWNRTVTFLQQYLHK